MEIISEKLNTSISDNLWFTNLYKLSINEFINPKKMKAGLKYWDTLSHNKNIEHFFNNFLGI